MKRTRLSLQHLAVAICLAFIAFPAWAQPPHANGAIVPGRLLVKFHNDVTPEKIQGILQSFAARSEREIPGIGVQVLSLPHAVGSEAAFEQMFKHLPEVEFAEIDQILSPQALSPNDTYYVYGTQWALPKISAPDAWSVATGSNAITIAIVDTGVDGTAPDLAAKMVPGWNVYDNNSNTADVGSGGGHGTLVAGIAGASTNNSTGIAGVCWGCMLMPVRVSSTLGSAAQSDIATGINWAATHGARVINLGFQVTGGATVSLAAFTAQGNNGCVVAATGSPCSSVVIAPSGDSGLTLSNVDDPNILEIGASDQNDLVPSWSDKGPFVDLVAPGVSIEATLTGGMYNAGTGTSFSAPHVSGVAGLVLSLNSTLRPADLVTLLKSSVDSLGGALGSGTGRLNALKAVNNAVGGSKTSTNTTLTSSLDPSASGQPVAFSASVSPSAATGTASFYDGAILLGTAALSSGTAQFSTSSLAVGSHSITASYSGASSFNGSSSPALAQTVNTVKSNTTTSLTSSPNPSASGQTVSFTAGVSPTAATGTVSFFDGTSLLGSAALGSGTAQFSTSSLSAGSHSITASYSGDSNYNGSTSPAMTQTVNPASKSNTTTSLTSSPNPSTSGQTVSFTASISPTAATGTVSFFDGTSLLGSAALGSGTAQFSTSSLSAGSHSITASYSGDSNYNGSTSPALTQTVNTGGKTNTTTSLASSLNPSNPGDFVMFTASVSPAAATGTMTFLDGSTTLATSIMISGVAQYSTTTVAAGSHSITARYNGDTVYNGSTSPVATQTVNGGSKTNTTTSLASSLNPSTIGQTVTFTATISSSAATGTASFFDGTSLLGTAAVSSGRAQFATSSLTAGSHSITATYSGDNTYYGSTSAALTQSVNATSKTNSTTSLSSSLNPSIAGQVVTFAAIVSPSSATGTMSFLDGGVQIGSATMSGGQAAFSTSSLSTGTHSITAIYGGDANSNGSTSAVLSQTVNTSTTANFSISISGNSNLKLGTTATFTVTITGSNGFAGPVTFAMASSPAGPVATFGPSTITGSGSTTMSIPTGALQKGIPYVLTVTATSGSLVHSVQDTLKLH